MDRNDFNFREHNFRQGVTDKEGKVVLTKEQKEESQRTFSCPTITMEHDDGRTVEINAHAEDDQAQWAKLGFKRVEKKASRKNEVKAEAAAQEVPATPAEPEAPKAKQPKAPKAPKQPK